MVAGGLQQVTAAGARGAVSRHPAKPSTLRQPLDATLGFDVGSVTKVSNRARDDSGNFSASCAPRARGRVRAERPWRQARRLQVMT